MSDLKLVITDKNGTEVYNSQFVLELTKTSNPAAALELFYSMQLLLHQAAGEISGLMQDCVDVALENSEVVESFIEWIEGGKPSGNLNGIAITSVNIEE